MAARPQFLPLPTNAPLAGNPMAPAPLPAPPPARPVPTLPKGSPLAQWLELDNVAEEMDASVLAQLGAQVVDDFSTDKESRAEWEKTYEEALKLAKQVKETKSTPWPNAANVKYPLLSVASIAFAARTFPEVVPPSGNIVGVQVIGKDPQGLKKARAERVAEFQNYQLQHDIAGWTEETDLLLHMLPIAAPCWRKLYWDGVGRAPAAEVYGPGPVVVHAKARRQDIPDRMTHQITDWTRNDIIERQRDGLWLSIDIGAPDDEDKDSEDRTAGYSFLEQYTWADLDGDGYAEPWIITVHEPSRQVVRIVPRFTAADVATNGKGEVVRIRPQKYWIAYRFIPNPDGGFYDLAFGSLLNPINETISSLINQLIDAGTKANTGGGFLGKGAGFRGGAVFLRPGEWKPIEVAGPVLRDSIIPAPVVPPSPVLFNLLEFLLQGAQQLAAVSDQTTGQKTSPNEPATTTLARLQEGLRVFSSIHRRVVGALTQEVRVLYRLNREHLDPEDYARVLDDPAANKDADFESEAADVAPTADPNIAGDMVRQARQQAILQTVAGAQGDVPEASRDVLKAMHLDDAEVERYLPQGPPPQMQALIEQYEGNLSQAMAMLDELKGQADAQAAQTALNQAKLDVENQKLAVERLKAEAELLKLQAPQPVPEPTEADPMAEIERDRKSLEWVMELEQKQRELDLLAQEQAEASQTAQVQAEHAAQLGAILQALAVMSGQMAALEQRMADKEVVDVRAERGDDGQVIGIRTHADGSTSAVTITR